MFFHNTPVFYSVVPKCDSPIIQDGKLVGAVTHVLINDPTTGYGIFIENMLNAAQMPMAKAS